MEQKTKFKINALPLLGIFGLLMVILYFLLANLGGSGAQTPQNDPYYLFRKLYQKLGYHLTVLPPQPIPRSQAGDLMIYLNFEAKNLDAKPALFIKRWLKRGGSVLVAGIGGSRDPLSSLKLKTSAIKTIRINPSFAAPGRTRIQLTSRFQGNYLRHFILDHDFKKEGIILDSMAGPLLLKTSNYGGSIFVLSDSALLTNEYLRDDNTAVFFNRLLGPYFTKRIYLIREDLSGSGNTVPLLAFLFQDKLLFISLQFLWMFGLFILLQGKRFGSPQLFDPYARRTLSDHLKAVGHFYQKTHSLRILDEINHDYFKYMLHKMTGFQWKDPPGPEELKKIEKFAREGNISKEQLMECLHKEPVISSNRLQNKAKTQDRIIKTLQKR